MRILVFLTIPAIICGQQGIPEKDTTPNNRKSSWGVVGMPVIFSTPETGFAGGAAALFYFNPSAIDHQSKQNQILVGAFLTQKKQYSIGTLIEWYFNYTQLKAVVNPYLIRYPSKFWGIGARTTEHMEEDFIPFEHHFKTRFLWCISPDLYIGPRYHFASMDIQEVEPNGQLSTGSITGSDGLVISGFGIQCSWDSRDNIYYPLQGFYTDLILDVYDRAIRSEVNFYQSTFDFRTYYHTIKTQVLAVQAKFVTTNGEIPFQMLPRMGGSGVMRGYYEGRYRDRHYIVVQSEYRIPIFWRIGAVFFIGLGQVTSSFSDFQSENFKSAGGAGVRFLWSEKEKINIRLDFGYSEDGLKYYVNIREAF